MLTIEGGWAAPLIEAYKQQDKYIWLGGVFVDKIDRAVTRYPSEKFEKFNLDWSGFDTSVVNRLIRTAFDILHAQIEWKTWDYRICGPAERARWEHLWDNTVEYFINTPILLQDGTLLRKSHGIPSGSWFTQLVGSIVNWILIRFLIRCALYKDHDLELDLGLGIDIKVLGDDSFFALPRTISHKIDLHQFAALAKSCFGMTLNPDKCSRGSTKDIKFLGFQYIGSYIYRPAVDWLGMALYPESNDLGPTYTFQRLLGLLLTSGGLSDVICELIEEIQETYNITSEILDFHRIPRNLRRSAKQVFGTDITKWLMAHVPTPMMLMKL